jgi:hypothetical protein
VESFTASGWSRLDQKAAFVFKIQIRYSLFLWCKIFQVIFFGEVLTLAKNLKMSRTGRRRQKTRVTDLFSTTPLEPTDKLSIKTATKTSIIAAKSESKTHKATRTICFVSTKGHLASAGEQLMAILAEPLQEDTDESLGIRL